MSYDYHRIFFIVSLLITSAYSCWNTSLNNITFGHVQSLNFHLGQAHPKNVSCSWTIHHEKLSGQSYYIVSLRTIELENDQNISTNELILQTDIEHLILNDINQRMILIPSSSSSADLQIYFRSTRLSRNLNIRRFSLEFIHITDNLNTADDAYFRCARSGLIIPKQWKCNCLYECLSDDYSDEENCPLCSMVRSSNTLLCHSNETWCLPKTNRTDLIDPNGVCIPSNQNTSCSYSSTCETTISYYQDHGDILLDHSLLSNRQSLCFVIIAKETHRVRLTLNQNNFIEEYPHLELLVYDGSEEENRLLIISDWFLPKQTVQTRATPIVTIMIRKRSLEIHHPDPTKMFINMSWLASRCPEDQMLCGGHFETKCYSKAQRCDGVWDCISGADELGCLSASCPTTFACHDPLRMVSDQARCYTWFERCNGNSFCVNRADEKNCTNWWCNSNNGTFLCKNRNCIYETWVCDGSDDCGDNSDEMNCPARVPRRVMTAAVMGATVCTTLFLIALGCSCKLFHLRSAERRASSRLLNPRQYLEQRRANLQRTSTTSTDDLVISAADVPRVAPPSYNQTMGVSDDNEERQALLAEHLRLAGLAQFIPLPMAQSSARRHRHRRRRRHRHHQCRRTYEQGSQAALIEPTVTPVDTLVLASSTNLLDRFRSLFTRNLSVNNNSISSHELDSGDYRHSLQSIILSIRSGIESRELPPPYSEEQLSLMHQESEMQSLTLTASPPSTTAATLIRIQKHQIPLNTIRDHLEEQPLPPSSSPLGVAAIDDDEQLSSDDGDDDDDKMLVP